MMESARSAVNTNGSPRLRWRFSLAQLMTLVLVICVALGVWSSMRNSWVRDVEEVLTDTDTTFHEAYLRQAYDLPKRETHRVLAQFAASSPKRAWCREQEMILYLKDWYDEDRSDEFAVSILCYCRPGEERALYTYTGFGNGLEIVELRSVDETHVEIDFVLLDPMADHLQVERGRVWTAKIKAVELIEYMDQHSSYTLGYTPLRCEWLLDHSIATGEVEPVPGDEAAR